MNVFSLLAKISLDTKDYDNKLEGARDKTNSFGNKLSSSLGTAGKVAAGVVAGVAAATAVVTKKMAEGIKETAEYGDNIDKMSQKMGMSAQAYQEWDFVLQHAGTSIETMKAGMKTLANAAESGNEAFQRLGITQEEMANMSQEELFGEVIKGLQGVEDTTERTYLAGQLLGRGATELGALLNMTAEETEAMRKQVHDLGGVMSDEAVKASAAYADSLQNLQTAVKGLSRGAFAEFLPSVVSVMDGLTDIFSGNSDKGLGLIKKGIEGFAKQLSTMIPKMMSIGSEIILSLIKAISDNLPTMMSGAVDTVMAFIQGLVEMLPQIIEAGVQVIIALIQGIGESLPTLIPAVVEAVLTIIQALIDNIPLLIDAVITFMMGMVEGIIAAIPKIVEALPALISGIIDGILSAIPQIIEAGIALLVALIENLPAIITGIVEHLPELIEGIITGIMQNLPAIIQAGVELFVALIKNTPKIIWEIVKRLPEIIWGIIKGIGELAWMLIESGVELMKNLGEGIAKWASEVWAKVKEVVVGAVKAIGEFFSDMWEAGLNLIKGLWEGIKSAASWLWDKITGFANDVVGWFKGAFGIKSPSRVMAGIGDMIGQGLALGIEGSLGDVLDAASDMHDTVNDALAGMGADVNVGIGGGLQGGLPQNDILSDPNKLYYLETMMYNAFARALSEVDIDWDDRNLGRLVRNYVG